MDLVCSAHLDLLQSHAYTNQFYKTDVCVCCIYLMYVDMLGIFFSEQLKGIMLSRRACNSYRRLLTAQSGFVSKSGLVINGPCM